VAGAHGPHLLCGRRPDAVDLLFPRRRRRAVPRVKALGLEIPNDEPLLFEFVPLQANFRTAPSLVERLNTVFGKVFAADDGSGVSFSAAQPMRDETFAQPSFALHLDFVPQASRGWAADPEASAQKEAARAAQVEEIVALIRGHLDRMEATRLARANGEDAKYRVAVLGRARTALAPIAQALRDTGIPFRALDLEKLQDRPEVLDALALAAPCSTRRTVWPGSAFCALPGADWRSVTFTCWPLPTTRPCATARCPTCWPSACRCSARRRPRRRARS